MRSTQTNTTSGFRKRSISGLILVVASAVVLLWCVSGFVLYFLLPSWSERGAFGDTFGAINALFSGMALAAVALAIFLQKQELELQREELTLTRQELQRAATSQQETQRIRSLQFLIELASRFAASATQYQQAWRTLRTLKSSEYVRAEDPRWARLIDALTACYESTRFLYQVAVLANNGIISVDSLNLLYRDEIRDHPESRLAYLADWCGTTHELAANYESRDVLRMATEIEKLLETTNANESCGGLGERDYQVERIREIRERLEKLGDPYE